MATHTPDQKLPPSTDPSNPILTTTPTQSIRVVPEDTLVITPSNKHKFIGLKEKIKIPVFPRSALDDTRKALSTSKLDNSENSNSQPDSIGNSDSLSEPIVRYPQNKRKRNDQLLSTRVSLGLLFDKKKKPVVNRQKVINDLHRLEKEQAELEKAIMEKKEETLSGKKDEKLEVKIEELEELSNKWREVAQTALWELHSKINENADGESRAKLSRIIMEMNIDPKMIGFDAELEDFESQ